MSLDELGFYHFWTNHLFEFVDKFQSFIHTNGIERSWRSLRSQIFSIKRTFKPKVIRNISTHSWQKVYINRNNLIFLCSMSSVLYFHFRWSNFINNKSVLFLMILRFVQFSDLCTFFDPCKKNLKFSFINIFILIS